MCVYTYTHIFVIYIPTKAHNYRIDYQHLSLTLDLLLWLDTLNHLGFPLFTTRLMSSSFILALMRPSVWVGFISKDDRITVLLRAVKPVRMGLAGVVSGFA